MALVLMNDDMIPDTPGIDGLDSSCEKMRVKAKKPMSNGKKAAAPGNDAIKGPWTRDEDNIVVQMVQKYGAKRWSLIASHIPVRQLLPDFEWTPCSSDGASSAHSSLLWMPPLLDPTMHGCTAAGS
jgi:hypothetical protein